MIQADFDNDSKPDIAISGDGDTVVLLNITQAQSLAGNVENEKAPTHFNQALNTTAEYVALQRYGNTLFEPRSQIPLQEGDVASIVPGFKRKFEVIHSACDGEYPYRADDSLELGTAQLRLGNNASIPVTSPDESRRLKMIQDQSNYIIRELLRQGNRMHEAVANHLAAVACARADEKCTAREKPRAAIRIPGMIQNDPTADSRTQAGTAISLEQANQINKRHNEKSAVHTLVTAIIIAASFFIGTIAVAAWRSISIFCWLNLCPLFSPGIAVNKSVRRRKSKRYEKKPCGI